MNKKTNVEEILENFPSNPEIYSWLRSQDYQREQGEQEYILLYELDIPRILKEFTEYILKKSK